MWPKRNKYIMICVPLTKLYCTWIYDKTKVLFGVRSGKNKYTGSKNQQMHTNTWRRINEEIHIVHISKYICQTTICISPHDSKVDFLPNDCRLVQSINTLTFFYKYLCGHSKKKYRLLNDTWTGNEPIKVSDLESSHCFIRRILLYL